MGRGLRGPLSWLKGDIPGKNNQTYVRKFLAFCRWGALWFSYRTGVRKPYLLKNKKDLRFPDLLGDKSMSAAVINGQYGSSISSIGGFAPIKTRSRRANIRLARALVLLSLTVVFGAGFAMQAGAGSKVVPAKADSYVVVTVAPGESIWSIAKAFNSTSNSQGDVRELVDQIIKVNSLQSADVTAGTKIRVPLA